MAAFNAGDALSGMYSWSAAESIVDLNRVEGDETGERPSEWPDGASLVLSEERE